MNDNDRWESSARASSPHSPELMRSPGSSGNLVTWLISSKLLTTKSIGKAIAYYALCSRGFAFFVLDLRRIVWRVLGWLYNAPSWRPAFSWLRLPLPWTLKRWHIALVAAGLLKGFHSIVSAVRLHLSPAARFRRRLLSDMDAAVSYSDWLALAQQVMKLDELEGGGEKLKDLERRLYERDVLEAKVRQLRAARERGDILELMFHLRSDLVRNFANLTNPSLHEALPLVPKMVEEYVTEVRTCIRFVLDCPPSPRLSIDDKIEVLSEARHAFGRTALVMSGGGALGCFHLGVVKSLLDANLMPRVIAGSSVGSIIASIVSTKSDEELREVFDHLQDFDLSFFSNRNTLEFIRHLLRTGTLQDISYLTRRMRAILGDMTFQEAYDKTGKILCICVTAADTNEPPRLMNYLTAPHAVIWSAVAASSAFPYLFEAQDILAKDVTGKLCRWAPHAEGSHRRWRDGSLEDDLPLRGLGQIFGINYTIVSQTNPHLIPIINLKRVLGRGVADVIEAEFKHRFNMLRKLVPEDSGTARVCRLFSQQWEGDVTVVIKGFFYPVEKLITDPTYDELEASVVEGQRAMWRKLSAVRSLCSVEITLDAALAKLQEQARLLRRAGAAATVAGAGVAGPGTGILMTPGNGNGSRAVAVQSFANPQLRSRIPSWVTMQGMGVPHMAGAHAASQGGRESGGFMLGSHGGVPGSAIGVGGGITNAFAAANAAAFMAAAGGGGSGMGGGNGNNGSGHATSGSGSSASGAGGAGPSVPSMTLSPLSSVSLSPHVQPSPVAPPPQPPSAVAQAASSRFHRRSLSNGALSSIEDPALVAAALECLASSPHFGPGALTLFDDDYTGVAGGLHHNESDIASPWHHQGGGGNGGGGGVAALSSSWKPLMKGGFTGNSGNSSSTLDVIAP